MEKKNQYDILIQWYVGNDGFFLKLSWDFLQAKNITR